MVCTFIFDCVILEVSIQLLMIVYVEDMARSVGFYEAIGLQCENPAEIDGWWTAFAIGDAKIALHHNGGEPLPPVSDRMHLNVDLPADGTLERLVAGCQAAGIEIDSGIADVGFGRFFRVRDPDGLPVQFNERIQS